MSNYFSHAYKNKQWVVTYYFGREWIYVTNDGGGSASWRSAKLFTRSGAVAVANRLRMYGKKARIKYQSVPSTRNMYR